jgi:hypothetical protein
MKLIIDKHSREIESTLENVKRIEIWVTEDKRFILYYNQFGELEVTKQSYGSEPSTITIKPSVSNQINLV